LLKPRNLSPDQATLRPISKEDTMGGGRIKIPRLPKVKGIRKRKEGRNK
jgi:hypothetical protein